MSAGIFGLMDAIVAFDLERGVKFETYCAPRIRGAILDELRSMDWVPRLVRSRAHKLDGDSKQLEVELGRTPTNDEIAKRLKISMVEFEKMAKDASAVGLVSLSRKWFETDSNKDVREIDVLEDKRGADPVREIQRKDLKELMTKGLSRAERLIIILYYFEEMTMKEIGATQASLLLRALIHKQRLLLGLIGQARRLHANESHGRERLCRPCLQDCLRRVPQIRR